ncbi:MAG TPA: two-component regulator propeller domain-containing protein [Marinilabiliaceae bacterium]|nr:two-component regulator propeller domain-containing protein [Marinilabiliaceae bacterium]
MIRVFRFITFFSIFLFHLLGVKGQEILRFDHFNTSRGLSQNTVTSILCDSKGFLWVGTNNGLNRYDGNKFRVYINEENGVQNFTHNRITHIWEDAKGFIWFETHDGHYHYFDPVREVFESLSGYFSDDESYHTLFSDFLQYSINEIWITTKAKGVFQLLFDASTHSYEIHPFTSRGFHSISNDHVRFIHKDASKNLWIGTDRGLTFVQRDGNENETLRFEHLFIDHTFTSVIETATELWFGTDDSGILIFQKGAQLYTYINQITSSRLMSNQISSLYITKTGVVFASFVDGGLQYFNSHVKRWTTISIHGTYVTSIYEDRFNKIWVTTDEFGLTYYDIESGFTKYFSFLDPETGTVPDEERHVFYEDSKDNFWVGSHEGGLNLFDRNTQEFIHYRNDPNDPNSLSANIVLSIAEDHSGQLWVGTGQFQGGLERIVLREPAFDHLLPSAANRYISDNIVRSVYEDESLRIWLGTKAGRLHVFESNKEEVYTFDRFMTQKGELTGVNVYSILIDQKGYLWLGSKGRGLLVSAKPLISYRNIGDISFINYQPIENDPTSLSHINVYSLEEDAQGVIWVGTYGNGINRVITQKDGHRSFQRITTANSELSSDLVRNILSDCKGRLWVATGYGLNLIETIPKPNEPVLVRTFFSGYDENSMSLNDIIHLYEDSHGTIWLATFGGGVNRLDSLSQTKAIFSRFNQMSGISNNVVYSILEDAYGYMWFGTENGLSRLNTSNYTVEVFNSNNGLSFNSFSENTCYLSRSGYLYFGGFLGVEMIHPDKILIPPFHKRVELTDFQLFNKEVQIGGNSPLSQGISYTHSIVLEHSQNSFSFEFSAMDYMETENTQYAYKMDNFDQEWNYVNNQRKAPYTNLSPGSYVFRVKATNRNGEWMKEERIVSLEILPPWYKTTWAFIFYSILVLLLFYAVYSAISKINRYRNDLKIERRVNEEKLRFFTNISHEIRTPLTLIIGPIEDLLRKITLDNSDKTKLEIIARNGRRMLQLTTQLLDFRKIQNNKMNLKISEFDMVSFTQNIYESFIPLANHKSIDYQFNTSMEKAFVWGDPSKLDTVIYNLISNALKFTEANKKVSVSIQESVEIDGIEVIVKDQGRGIKRENLEHLFGRYTILSGEELAGTGIGLSLAFELTRLHDGNIVVNSEVNEGSTFTLRLKSGKAHFLENKNVVWNDKVVSYSDLPNGSFSNLKDVDQLESEIILDSDSDQPLVLVVEDNHEIGEYICRSLSPEFSCCLASNGQEALDLLKTRNPYLIISDVMMPVMDGFELTRRVREDFSTSHIPIILLTSKSSVEDQIAGVEHGADMYITKPFNSGFLKASAKNLFEQRSNLISKFRDNRTIDPATLKVNSKDEEFLQKLISFVEENYSEEFTIESLADEMCVSRTVFYNKVKGLTGLSPVEFVRQLKLKIAAHFLVQGYNVSEAAMKVGFTDTRYFSRQFKAFFGHLPSKHVELKKKEDESNKDL